MAIIKNEPVFEFKDEDYCKPRHIIVEGSYEEIGYDLGKLAREEYGTKLRKYRDPVYAKAKRDYLERNWPERLAESKGVLRAFDLAEDDNTFDPTNLMYDLYGEGEVAESISGPVLDWCYRTRRPTPVRRLFRATRKW